MQTVKIKSIKKLSQVHDRYDLTMPHHHNFFANGICIHNTSGRTGHVLDEVPINYSGIKKLGAKLFPSKFPASKREWVYLHGSRNVILGESSGKGYYGDDTFRIEAAKPFIGNLHKGETVYYEIVGWATPSTPIMAPHSTTSLKDKEILKMYGPEMVYSYGCNPEIPGKERAVFVYRITVTNEDGKAHDLSWREVKARCAELGVKHVPELTRFWYDGNKETLITHVQEHVDGPDVLDKSHIREGVCLRVEGYSPARIYKEKSFTFKVLEGIVKDSDVIDIEEAS